MKHLLSKTLTLAIATMCCYGCTNTDSGTGNMTAETATVTEEEQLRPQSPMDPDTDMSQEKAEQNRVSADNQLGSEQSIVALLRQRENFSTFVELIRAADLVVTLESPAPYTVFAPTNEAFAALPAGTLEALKSPSAKTDLTRLIQAHVLPNRITSEEMRDSMPMITAMGQEVMVKRTGGNLMVGGANVILADVQASNGVVHVVDKVLVPPN